MATSSNAGDSVLLVTSLWLTSTDTTFIFNNGERVVVPSLVDPLRRALLDKKAAETLIITLNAFPVIVFGRIPFSIWKLFGSNTTKLVITGNNFMGMAHDIVAVFEQVTWLECLTGKNTDPLSTYDRLLSFNLNMLM